MPLLDVRDLSKRFGGLAAVSILSFSVETGEIVGLIGPNGAGKTTCFDLLCRFLSPTSGPVLLACEGITRRRQPEAAGPRPLRPSQHATLSLVSTVVQHG